jgi:hypothetical protein
MSSFFPSPFAKKLKTQTEGTSRVHKTILSKKAAHKMLVKLAAVVNFINTLLAAFALIFFHIKITKPNCN